MNRADGGRDSLGEDVGPSSPNKVPGQRLANHVIGDVDDGGGGVLLPDLLWIQSVFQVPDRSEQKRLSGDVRRHADVVMSPESDLLSNHGCLVQARAERSFSASDAMLLF